MTVGRGVSRGGKLSIDIGEGREKEERHVIEYGKQSMFDYWTRENAGMKNFKRNRYLRLTGKSR